MHRTSNRVKVVGVNPNPLVATSTIRLINHKRKVLMEKLPAKVSYGNPDINEVLETFTRLTGIKLTNIKRQRQFASTLLRTESKARIPKCNRVRLRYHGG